MTSPESGTVRIENGAAADISAEVRSQPLWYHTLELGDGVVTPGWFDLRPIADALPWPDVDGKRCLDVGTYDGFFAFELERRGAAEVVATDIADHRDWDWPPKLRASGSEYLRELAGPDKTRGFQIAHRALRSKVEHRLISIYDLAPETVGTFDVVVCGGLMLHLRDPLRALQAIRSVCTESFLSAEAIALGLTVRHPRLPLAKIDGLSSQLKWFVPNAAGHARMVESAGFKIERRPRPYAEPFGAAHPKPYGDLRTLARVFANAVLLRRRGVPYQAILARPV
jgi:tRNA (mo5U34)-methyltransferase